METGALPDGRRGARTNLAGSQRLVVNGTLFFWDDKTGTSSNIASSSSFSAGRLGCEYDIFSRDRSIVCSQPDLITARGTVRGITNSALWLENAWHSSSTVLTLLNSAGRHDHQPPIPGGLGPKANASHRYERPPRMSVYIFEQQSLASTTQFHITTTNSHTHPWPLTASFSGGPPSRAQGNRRSLITSSLLQNLQHGHPSRCLFLGQPRH